MKEVYFRKAAYIFISIDKYTDTFTSISRKLQITPSYVSKILNKCEKAGLLESIRAGRKRIYVYTNKGREIKNNMIKVLRMLEK